MGDKSRGLYNKFNVTRTDGSSEPGGKHDGCDYFVLDLSHDPYAIPALMAYHEACQALYPRLASDILTKIRTHCDHEWTDKIRGRNRTGVHCMYCGVDQ
jgi:hypothetical protein